MVCPQENGGETRKGRREEPNPRGGQQKDPNPLAKRSPTGRSPPSTARTTSSGHSCHTRTKQGKEDAGDESAITELATLLRELDTLRLRKTVKQSILTAMKLIKRVENHVASLTGEKTKTTNTVDTQTEAARASQQHRASQTEESRTTARSTRKPAATREAAAGKRPRTKEADTLGVDELSQTSKVRAPAIGAPSQSPSPVAERKTWQTVRLRRRPNKGKPADEGANGPNEQASALRQPRKRRRRRPVQAEAVIIKGAGGTNVSYAEMLRRVRSSMNPEDVGAKVAAVRRTREGELLLELERGSSGAPALQEALATTLGETMMVRALLPRTTIEVRDLDEATDEAELREALKNFTSALDYTVAGIQRHPDGHRSPPRPGRKDVDTSRETQGGLGELQGPGTSRSRPVLPLPGFRPP